MDEETFATSDWRYLPGVKGLLAAVGPRLTNIIAFQELQMRPRTESAMKRDSKYNNVFVQ